MPEIHDLSKPKLYLSDCNIALCQILACYGAQPVLFQNHKLAIVKVQQILFIYKMSNDIAEDRSGAETNL